MSTEPLYIGPSLRVKAQREKKQVHSGPVRLELMRHRVILKYVYLYFYMYPGNYEMEEQATAILSETGAFLTLMHSNSGLLSNSATLVMVPEKLMTFYHNVLV